MLLVSFNQAVFSHSGCFQDVRHSLVFQGRGTSVQVKLCKQPGNQASTPHMHKKDDETLSMEATKIYDFGPEPTPSFNFGETTPTQLSKQYSKIVQQEQVAWELNYRLVSRLGSGGQGVVFLGERSGAFDKTFYLALKFYRPDGYQDVKTYRKEMSRLAQVTMEISDLQHDHIMDVHNVVEYQGILVLATEWVKGFNLRELILPTTLKHLKGTVSDDRWNYINDVVLTNAGFQSRFLPGVAIAILRECLAGVSALHRENIIHADLKPANVMVKQTGNVKIIDLGSAFSTKELPLRPTWTPRYAAVEVLEGDCHTPQSDIASLGYIFFELLTGIFPFAGVPNNKELITVKKDLWKRFPDLLPADVARNTTIVELISKMIAPDPADRFQTMDDADSSRSGATKIQNQLVKTDLSTDGPQELRHLMNDLANVERPTMPPELSSSMS